MTESLSFEELLRRKQQAGFDAFFSKDKLAKRIEELIPLGLSAAVYTQTTDVEGEINGFMTYDRKVIKMPVNELKRVNDKLYLIPAP